MQASRAFREEGEGDRSCAEAAATRWSEVPCAHVCADMDGTVGGSVLQVTLTCVEAFDSIAAGHEEIGAATNGTDDTCDAAALASRTAASTSEASKW